MTATRSQIARRMESEATHLRHLAEWLEENADAEIVQVAGTVSILGRELELQAAKVVSMGDVA